jgi:hypothetical protein
MLRYHSESYRSIELEKKAQGPAAGYQNISSLLSLNPSGYS